MKKNKIALLFSGIILATGLVGCTPDSNIEDSTSILKNFEKIVYEQEGSRYDIKEYIDKNISSLKNIDMSSSMVSTFIYSIYQNMDVYTNMVFSLQGDFAELEKVLDVKSVNSAMLSKIPDNYKVVKALLEELDDNFLMLIKSNGSYTIDVDMKRIKETFLEYLDTGTLNYLDFRIKENDSDVYDMNSDEYDIKLLLDRANDICTNLENLEGTSQKENWVQHLCYYLEMIFSKSQTTFLDDDNKILIDKFNQLKDESDKYTDVNFGKLLNKYINLLEKNNYDVNSEEVNTFIEDVYNQLDVFLVDNE